MTKEELRKEWESKVDEFKSSGQSQSAWCREKNINLRTFNHWIRKFRTTSEPEKMSTSWLPIEFGVFTLI